MILEIFECFVTLFIIIDPFISGAVFVSYSKNMTEKEKHKSIWTAINVAGALLLIFLFFGLSLLHTLGITFNGFKIAGGVILLVLGVTTVLGIQISSKIEGTKSAAILIGTPLLSGPGALTTIIILSEKFGYWIPLIAAIAVLVLSWFILHYSEYMAKFLGTEMIEVFSKILGLLIAALAVDYIYQGVVGFIGG